MRAEAVKLLAQLLREARRTASAGRSAGGVGDE